jgi:YfiH family protein
VIWTTTTDGDLSVDAPQPDLDRRRRAVVDRPWTWLRQVHGARVVRVGKPGEHAGVEADAAVTSVPGAPVAVQTADCVPIALVADGAVGVVHAGWRGLAAGVVEAAVHALCEAGNGPVRAQIGPCIRARCYEFGPTDLDRVASRLGDGVRGTTAWGTPALDVVQAATAALTHAGVSDVVDSGVCTACSPVHFSHRARGDTGRQALVAWLGP